MSDSDFGKLRTFLWPIHRSELKQFVPMLVVFFLICFNYNLLRAAKDALVVTAPKSGAEVIPYLKVWAIVPAAFLMTFIFTRLSNKLSRENLFYVLFSIFLLFFLLFAFVLYPFRDYLHPTTTADWCQAHLPLGCKGLIAVFRNWTFTLFYIMSEMWSTIIMTVLFWGFANEVTSVKDATRFYGLFGVGANFSGIFSGQMSMAISSHAYNPSLPFGRDSWGQAVVILCLIVIFTGIACMALFRYLHTKGLGYNSLPHIPKKKPTSIKMGMRKNFAFLSKSKYLLLIALIVVTYNISENLIEVVWKDQVRQLYPNPEEFNAYMGKVLTAIGIIATSAALFVSGNVIRQFGWTVSALIPPAIILLTGTCFFSYLLFKLSFLSSMALFLGCTPLALGVFFGSLQNCLARASKYTLFDATKELAFVPLSLESKLKGKAAIDGVGSRLGKSGGSLIHQSLLLLFGTVALSTPVVGVLLLFSVGGWILAVKALGREFYTLSQQSPAAETLKPLIP
ncbi:MAG TPA: AAA family ATPase [Parachlamydiales bacterium]|nr:AAA family ATPase [Parachlamydiales bacterium]